MKQIKYVKLMAALVKAKSSRFLSMCSRVILNDKSDQMIDHQKFNIQNPKKKSQLRIGFSTLAQKLAKLMESLPLFMPQKPFKLIWDCIQFYNILSLFFYILFSLASDSKLGYLMNEFQFFGSKVIQSLDILIELNSGYYEQGKCITDREQVIRNYGKNYLLLDFLMCVNLWISSEINSWFLLFYYFKIKKVGKLLKSFEERLNLDLNNYNYIQLFKLLLFVVFFSHIIACIWMYIARLDEDINWVIIDQIATYGDIYGQVNFKFSTNLQLLNI